MPKHENNPNRVIVHCTATRDLPRTHPDFNKVDIDMVRRWHKSKGWKDVGYHVLIKKDGTIQYGRPFSQYGAHTAGQNKNTLGVALVGTRRFTEAQVESFVSLFQIIFIEYEIPYNRWFCHYNYAKKECPGISLYFLRKLLYFATPEKKEISTTIH